MIDRNFQLRLQDWLDGRLSPSERVDFEAELSSDEEKAATARKFKELNENLKDLNREIASEPIPDSLLAVLRKTQGS